MADALGAIVGFGTGIMNNQVSQYNAKKDFERQKELMRLSHQYSLQDFAIQNSYNSPKANMQRLKDAGLNPDMVYGSGSVGVSDASVPQRGAPGSSMAETIPFNNPVLDAVSAAQGMAAAKKAGAETIGQKIQNDFDLKSFQDRLASFGKQNNKTDAEIKKLGEEAANLQQEFSVMTAQLNLWHLDEQEKHKRLDQMDERFSKEMREFDDKHKLSHEEYRRLRNTYDDFIRTMKASADEAEANAKMADLMFRIENDWKETEKGLGVFGTFIKILKMVIG